MSIDLGDLDKELIEPVHGASGSKRRIYVVVLPLARMALTIAAIVIVVGAAVAGYWFGGGADALQRLMSGEPAPEVGQAVIDMPEVIVNMRGTQPARFLKIGITLSLAAADKGKIEQAMPRLIDAEHEFMRNVDRYDLEGSAGLARLRAEMLRRVDLIVGPGVVTDVLLRSILTQ
jgi:flagellar protein FliL